MKPQAAWEYAGSIGNVINPGNRSCSVEVQVPNKSGFLKPNGIATIRLKDFEADSAIVVPAIDQDVYITYGDRVGPDDRVRTNYDGDFAFYGLRPGDYTIYVYSEDTMPTSNNAPDVAIIQQVTIEKGDETLELEPIRIYEDI